MKELRPIRIGRPVAVLRALAAAAVMASLAGCSGSSASQGAAPTDDPPPPIANRAPIAAPDQAKFLPGVALALDVLANDSDPDGESVSLLAITQPASGLVTIDDAGTPAIQTDDRIVYVPTATGIDPVSFSYTIGDPRDGRTTGVVTLSVVDAAGSNPAVTIPAQPIATGDAAATDLSAPVSIDVLSNDAVPDGFALSAIMAAPPLYGTAVLDDNGTPALSIDDRITYTPSSGYSGLDRFDYSIGDGSTTRTATVHVAVGPPPAAPRETVCGRIVKGPVSGALVGLYPVAADGSATSTVPVAIAMSDAEGFWCVSAPQDRGALLVTARGGSYADESDTSEPPRRITLEPSLPLETLLPADERFVTTTLLSAAVLDAARLAHTGGAFVDSFETFRQQVFAAFGFDAVALSPPAPAEPASHEAPAARRYGLVLGGLNGALNRVAVSAGMPASNPDLLRAVIRDLTDCRLDGSGRDGPVSIGASGIAMPTDIDLGLEMLRFRNNRAEHYPASPVPAIDVSFCQPPAAPAPDTLVVTGQQSIAVVEDDAVTVSLTDLVVSGASGTYPAGYSLVLGGGVDHAVSGSTVVPAPDFSGTLIVPTIVTDGTVSTAPFPLSIDVTPRPDAPVFSSAPGMSVPADAVYTYAVAAMDPDAGQSLSFAADTLPAWLTLTDHGDGTATVTGTPVHADAGFHAVSLTVTDDDSPALSATQSFSIEVTTPPAVTTMTPIAFAENLPSGQAVGMLSTSGGTFTYTLVARPGDDDNAAFYIDGATVRTAYPLDHEAGAYTVRVRAVRGSASIETVFTINAGDGNDAPTNITFAGTSPPEDSPPGTVAGTLSTVDPDAGDSHVYTLVTGAGDDDNGRFSVSGDTLVTAVELDFEDKDTYRVRVRTDDGEGGTLEAPILVSIVDVNDAPTGMTLDNSTIAEGSAPGTPVGNLSTTDQDAGDTHLYALVAGSGDTDNALFQVVGSSLRSAAVLDYETQSIRSVRIETDDGNGGRFARAFTIAVSDGNDAPVANADEAVTPVDVAIAIDVLANDTDPNGDALAIVGIGAPTASSALVSINDAGTPADPSDDWIEYLPEPGFEGNDSFDYDIGDGQYTATATVTVTVSDSGFVASIVPANGAFGVAPDADVQIVFDRPMDESTLDDGSVWLATTPGGPSAVTANLVYDGGILTLEPGEDLLTATFYYVVIRETVRSASGLPMGFPIESRFRTEVLPEDKDGDRLTAVEEATLAAGPHPCLDDLDPDADGDGLSDGLEVEASSDPCSADGQQVYYVDDDGPSADWPTATATLPAAPIAGSAGMPTFVLIAEGDYNEPVTLGGACDYIVYAGSLDPADPGQMPVSGLNAVVDSTLDMGGSSSSVVDGCTGFRITDLKFRRGSAIDGGGLHVTGGADGDLERIQIVNSDASRIGAGLAVTGPGTNVRVANSVFRANTLTNFQGGGGAAVGPGATLTMLDTRLLYNTVQNDGGGLYVMDGATVDVRNSTISGNSAGDDGGGIAVRGATTAAVFDGLILSSNFAADAGGAFQTQNVGSSVGLYNSLLIGNYGGGSAGAIHLLLSADPVVRNVTAVYNQTAAAVGAAVRVSTSTAIVADSILARNRASNRQLSSPPAVGDAFSAPSPAWSSYNLVESPDGNAAAGDIDITLPGPGFEEAFYLHPSSSLAVDSGSTTVPGPAPLALDQLTTDVDGDLDSGTLDRGYHYPGALAGTATSVSLTAPSSGRLTAGSPDYGVIKLRPRVDSSNIGKGQEVVVRYVSGPPGLQLVAPANIGPYGPDTGIAADRGNGTYNVLVSTTAASPGTLTIEVIVNGTSLGTIPIPVD